MKEATIKVAFFYFRASKTAMANLRRRIEGEINVVSAAGIQISIEPEEHPLDTGCKKSIRGIADALIEVESGFEPLYKVLQTSA